LYNTIEFAESNDTADPNLLLHAYYVLALAKYRSGDYESAIDLSYRSIEKASEKLKSFPVNIYQKMDPFSMMSFEYDYRVAVGRWPINLIKASYYNMGDYKNALKYITLRDEANKEIYLEDNKVLIAMLEAESEAEKIKNQITILERDNEISNIRAEQARNMNIAIIFVFLIILVMGVLFFRQNRMRSNHKRIVLEQKLLRLQMNPHFIFNALSSIHSLINPKDVDRAADYMGRFSRLLRTSLESSREDYILLEDEISSMKNYMELQSLRYDNKFDYSIETDEAIDLESAIIPPMLLQPFIENAIEHGIRHKEDKGSIVVRFIRDGEKMSCEIEDDGIGREKTRKIVKQKEHKSLATDIIRDRIAVLNKKIRQKISLSIIDLKSDADEAMGTLIRLDLPYLLD
jgi:LytS/YehU family sensor histidine kinase